MGLTGGAVRANDTRVGDMAARRSVVIYYGCRQNIPGCSLFRHNLLGQACKKVLPLWKREINEIMDERNVGKPASDLP